MEKVGHVENVQFGEGIVVRIEVLSVLAKQDEDAVYYAIEGECRVTVDGNMEYKGIHKWESDPRDPPTDWRVVARVALIDLYHRWESRAARIDEAIAAEELRAARLLFPNDTNPSTS